MRSWIESFGRASSAPPGRPLLTSGRASCRELFEQPRLQISRPNTARARLEQAPDLRASDVDAPSRADALELAGSRPTRERAAADRNVRRREDGGGLGERDPVRRDARHVRSYEPDAVELDAVELDAVELGAVSV